MEFDAILNVLFGVAIGVGMVIVYAWYQFQILKSQIDRMIEEAVTEKSSIELDIEVDKGVYFCYNSESKQFVCQGTTALEIRQALQNRFPGKAAYLVGGDPVIVAQFKAELETNENSTSI
jgi:hypothetical protein